MYPHCVLYTGRKLETGVPPWSKHPSLGEGHTAQPRVPCPQVLYLPCGGGGTGAQKIGGRLLSYECWQSPTGHVQLQDQDLTCHICYTPGKPCFPEHGIPADQHRWQCERPRSSSSREGSWDGNERRASRLFLRGGDLSRTPRVTLLSAPTGLPLLMEGRERTSEKQSGKTRASKLQKWYSGRLSGPPHLAPSHLQPTRMPPLVWSYPEPQDP